MLEGSCETLNGIRSDLRLRSPLQSYVIFGSSRYIHTIRIILMSFVILPASVADLAEIIVIYHAAFKQDRIIGNLMPNVPLDEKKAHDHEWYKRSFDTSHLNGMRFYKAVDETGKMVGYAKWQYPHTLTVGEKEEKRKLDDAENEGLRLPKGTDTELHKAFFDPLHEKRKKYVKTESDYCESLFQHCFCVSGGSPFNSNSAVRTSS